MTTNKRRIIRQQQAAGLSEVAREQLLTGQDFFNDKPFASEQEQLQVWKAHRTELLEEWQKDNGLFTRPWSWWRYEAPELREVVGEDGPPLDPEPGSWGKHRYGHGEIYETEKSYFLRHPELQTTEERKWLETHQFSKWELMPVSEMTDIKDFIGSANYRTLLRDDELRALEEYLKSKSQSHETIH